MGTVTLVPVETYLRTAYRPDRDYIDGEVLERNMGEIPHGRVQGFFRDLFVQRQTEWKLEAIPEVRVQVNSTRYRVPDLTVLQLGGPDDLIVRSVPVCCIEIFSRDDRMREMQERVADYARMGVPAIWVVDPWRRVAYIGQADGRLLPEEGTLAIPGTSATVAVEEIFAELDRLGQPG